MKRTILWMNSNVYSYVSFQLLHFLHKKQITRIFSINQIVI